MARKKADFLEHEGAALYAKAAGATMAEPILTTAAEAARARIEGSDHLRGLGHGPSADNLARVRAATIPFDPAAVLDTPEAVAAFLDDAMGSEDSATIAEALGVAARAQGLAGLAKSAQVNRSALYRTLSKDGNPELATLLRVLHAMGVRLSVVPRAQPKRRRKAS